VFPSKDKLIRLFGIKLSAGIPAGILKFRSDSVILPPELRNIYMNIPDFSGVFLLRHSRKLTVLHNPTTAKRA
jgi:hypothetical protein